MKEIEHAKQSDNDSEWVNARGIRRNQCEAKESKKKKNKRGRVG
jgi:hypothetical protein